jgi:hypothetical protein
MFRRRRQTAPVLLAPAPELSSEALFELINDKLTDIIGASGEWTLVRRADGDTDEIFHTMLSRQIAGELTRTVEDGRDALRNEPGTEPSALSWNPAPVAVWAEQDRADQNRGDQNRADAPRTSHAETASHRAVA